MQTDYPERPECDFTEYPVRRNYIRCTWCHGVRSKKETLFKHDKPFCGVRHLLKWEQQHAPRNN